MINKDFWKNKKVFLTGHTGFKGSWLSIWLHELGASVYGYALDSNTNPSLFELANVKKIVESTFGDIRDLQALKSAMQAFQPDIIIHMAAQPLVRESYENPVDTYSTNLMGTVNVLESVRFCPSVKAIINVTTDKVYENKEWVWGYRETDRLGGFDPYSNSKACSELVTSSYMNSFFNPNEYKHHGVAIATARAGNVIGGGDWARDRLIPDIIRAIERDEKIIIRNPNAVRPWQHVLEPLCGYLMLAEKLYSEGPKWNGAWNFGPDESNLKSVSSIVTDLIKLLNYSPSNLKLIPSNLHEAQLLVLENSKSRKYLNWVPKLNYEQTLKMVFEWYSTMKNEKSTFEICLKQINDFIEKTNSI